MSNFIYCVSIVFGVCYVDVVNVMESGVVFWEFVLLKIDFVYVGSVDGNCMICNCLVFFLVELV